MMSEAALWRARTCAIEARRARELGQVAGPIGWIDDTVAELDRELEDVSRVRQPDGGDLMQLPYDSELLTTREVAEMIGWGMRRIQRHSDQLGARKVSGRLLFPTSVIREHIEGAQA